MSNLAAQKQLSLRLSALIPWLIATFYAFFQFQMQTAAGIMGPQWMHDFHINKVGLSNLSAAFFYTYMLMQIPAGILFDRYSVRYILSFAALILTCGCFLLAYTENYPMAVVARLLMGLGSAFGFVGLLQICTRHFPPHRFALMVGISEGFTMLGVTGGIMFLTWLVTHWSWRSAVSGGGIIAFILMILTFLWVRESAHVSHVVHPQQFISFRIIMKRLKIIFSDQQIILNSLFGFFTFSIVNVFASLWGMSFLMHTSSQLSPQTAADMIAVIFAGIAAGGPLCGWLSKKLNQKRRVLMAGGLCESVAMGVIIFCPHLPEVALFILFFLTGLFCSVYILCFSLIKDSVSPVICATALATTNMLMMTAAPVLQLVIGGLLQHHFFGLTDNISLIYRLSLSILPIGMFIAFLSAFWIKETIGTTGPRFHEKMA